MCGVLRRPACVAFEFLERFRHFYVHQLKKTRQNNPFWRHFGAFLAPKWAVLAFSLDILAGRLAIWAQKFECNTFQHLLDAPPGGIGRAMMSSLRFSISRFASHVGGSGPHPIWEMLPRGQKKSNRHRNTSCVVFSPQSVSQQSVWALKVRLGKIDVGILHTGTCGLCCV